MQPLGQENQQQKRILKQGRGKHPTDPRARRHGANLLLAGTPDVLEVAAAVLRQTLVFTAAGQLCAPKAGRTGRLGAVSSAIVLAAGDHAEASRDALGLVHVAVVAERASGWLAAAASIPPEGDHAIGTLAALRRESAVAQKAGAAAVRPPAREGSTVEDLNGALEARRPTPMGAAGHLPPALLRCRAPELRARAAAPADTPGILPWQVRQLAEGAPARALDADRATPTPQRRGRTIERTVSLLAAIDVVLAVGPELGTTPLRSAGHHGLDEASFGHGASAPPGGYAAPRRPNEMA